MNYLLLAVLSIIAYTEVLPTLSLIFEYIRTWLALGITITQQKTVIIQEQTQEAQASTRYWIPMPRRRM